MQLSKSAAFKSSFWLMLVYCLLVIGLQLHCTITAINAPLRLSLSDVFLVPLILLCFNDYLKQSIPFQNILVDFNILIWFIVFTLWLSFSLWWGYYNSGVVQPWACINKFLGWFILVSYFFMGSFFSKNLKDFLPIILRTLFISSWLVSGYFLVGAVVLNNFNYLLPRIEYNRFAGFLENPSAYGLLSAAVLLLQLPFLQKNKLFNNSTHYLGVTLGLTSVMHSGSRTAIIALLCSLIFLCSKMKLKKRDYIHYVHCILYTLLIVVMLQLNFFNIYGSMQRLIANPTLQFKTTTHSKIQLNSAQDQPEITQTSKVQSLESMKYKPTITGKYDYVYQLEIWQGGDYGGKKRVELTMDALKLWIKNPILGCGLGGFLHSQDVSYEQISKYEVFYSSINPAMMNVLPTKSDAIILHSILSNCHVYIIKNHDWIRYENGTIRLIASYTNNFPKFPTDLNGVVKDNHLSNERRNFILEILSNSKIAPVSIHNTAVWLLTETGSIGLLLFCLFVVYVIRKIYTASNKDNELIVGGTAVLILFILASLTTEVMYQRHLWFMAGLILASLKNENLLDLAKNRQLRSGFLWSLGLGPLRKWDQSESNRKV